MKALFTFFIFFTALTLANAQSRDSIDQGEAVYFRRMVEKSLKEFKSYNTYKPYTVLVNKKIKLARKDEQIDIEVFSNQKLIFLYTINIDEKRIVTIGDLRE